MFDLLSYFLLGLNEIQREVLHTTLHTALNDITLRHTDPPDLDFPIPKNTLEKG